MNAQFLSEPLADAGGFRVVVQGPSKRLSYREWLTSLRDGAFADAFVRCLADLPLPGFAWECRPVTRHDLDAPMDMVAMDSPLLAEIAADPSPFAAQLGRAGSRDVITFDNLGRDAHLVVPVRLGDHDCYAHLGSFVRGAPPAQQRSFFRTLALTVEELVAQRTRPLWLSTAGLGVSWLHVRLDERPKYYRHGPFRRAPGTPV